MPHIFDVASQCMFYVPPGNRISARGCCCVCMPTRRELRVY